MLTWRRICSSVIYVYVCAYVTKTSALRLLFFVPAVGLILDLCTHRQTDYGRTGKQDQKIARISVAFDRHYCYCYHWKKKV